MRWPFSATPATPKPALVSLLQETNGLLREIVAELRGGRPAQTPVAQPVRPIQKLTAASVTHVTRASVAAKDQARAQARQTRESELSLAGGSASAETEINLPPPPAWPIPGDHP